MFGGIGVGGKMLINVRICVLFKETFASEADDDDESNEGHIFIGLGKKAGDMYKTRMRKSNLN